MNDLSEVLSGEMDGEEQDPQKQYSPDNPFAPKQPAKTYSPDNPFAGEKAALPTLDAPSPAERYVGPPPKPSRSGPVRPLRTTKEPIQNYDPRPFDNVLTRAIDSPEALHENAIADREAAESSSIPATPTPKPPLVLPPLSSSDPGQAAADAYTAKYGRSPSSVAVEPADGKKRTATVTVGRPLQGIGQIVPALAGSPEGAVDLDRIMESPDLQTRIAARLAAVHAPEGYTSQPVATGTIGDALASSLHDLTKIPQGNTVVDRTARAVTDMATHPVQTAVGFATALPKAAFTLGQYAGQEVGKLPGMAKQQTDMSGQRLPGATPISPTEAAWAAGQLLTTGVAGKFLPELDAVFGRTMARSVVKAVDAGESPTAALLKGYAARTAAHAATGASIGAVFAPDDPTVGAILGAAIGGAHAARETPFVDLNPEQQVLNSQQRAGRARLAAPEQTPVTATGRVVPEPLPTEPDFAVETNSVPDALDQLTKKYSADNPFVSAENQHNTANGLHPESIRDVARGTPEPEPTSNVVGFTTSKGSEYRVEGQGTSRNKTATGESFGASDKTIYVSPETAQSLMERLQLDGVAGHHAVIRPLDDGTVAYVVKDKAGGTVRNDRSARINYQETPAEGLTPIEVWNKTPEGDRQFHIGHAITSIGRAAPTPEAPTPQAVNPERSTLSSPQVPASAADRATELEQTIKQARKVYASARKNVPTTPDDQQRQVVLIQNLESVIASAKKEYDQVTAADRGMVVDHDGEVRFPSAYSDGGSPREIPRVATSALIDDLVDLTDRLQTSAGRSANVLRPDDGFYSSNDGRAAFVASAGPLGRKGPSQQAAARTNAADQQARLAAVHAELVKRGLTDDDIAEHFFERSAEKAGKAQDDNAVTYNPSEHDVIRDEHGAVLFEPPASYSEPLPGEHVKAPAVWLPNGRVIEGPSHFMALRKAREKGLVDENWHPDFDRNDGWVTSHRPFVSRETAYAIADQADQLGAHGKAEGTNQLYHVDFQPSTLNEGGAEYVGKQRPKLTGKMLAGAETSHPTETPEFKRWFGESKAVNAEGKPLVVYHGSQRPDRIGARLMKKRATSGPMPFFTESPEIASRYAEQKRDTSLQNEDVHGYESWFRLKVPGEKNAVNIDRAWWRLSSEQRDKIRSLAPRVWMGNDGEKIQLGPEGHDSGLGGFDQHLKEARGNVLKALVDEWLNSAALFNDESEFHKVLDLAGVDVPVEMHDPEASYPGVLPVYLSIRNPLVTSEISPSVINALQSAANRQRAPRTQSGADTWDKALRDPQHWMQELKNDVAKGKNSFVWSSIPDWVTKTLKGLGYDGIRDIGGKMGGDEHAVWIPFEPQQVKSAIGNRGTFDPNSPNITNEPHGQYDKSQLDAFSELQQHPDSPEAKRLSKDEAEKAYGSVAKLLRAENELRPFVEQLRQAGIEPASERQSFVASMRSPAFVNLTGLDVSTPRRLRSALTVMRHPLSEQMSVLFKNEDGVVVDHFVYSSGALRVVTFDLPKMAREVIEHARKLGVRTVTASHNHPSGDPTFSSADRMFTHALGAMLDDGGVQLDGHMTIDHDTAMWVTPNREGGFSEELVHVPHADSQEWTTAVQRGASVATAQNVAALVRDSVSPEATTVLYRDSQGRIIAGEPMSAHVLPESLLQHIDEQRGTLAVYDAIIATHPERSEPIRAAIVAARQAGHTKGIYVTDVVEVYPNGTKAPLVRSSVERGFLAPPDIHGRDRIDTANARLATRVDDGAALSQSGHHAADYGAGRRTSGVLNEPTDLFGNEDESEKTSPSESNQGSLFSPRQGTVESRSLSQTERAAKSELDALRAKAQLTSSPLDKIKIARRIAELEKLVNRDKAISADEMATRAKAGEQGDLLGEPTPEYDAKSGQYVDTSVSSPARPMPEPTGMGERRSTVRPIEFARTIQSIFNPESLGPIAKGTAGNIRHETAIRFRAYTQAAEDLRDLQKHVDKQPRQRQVELWDAYERGVPTGDPYVDAANKVFRATTEQRTQQLVALNKLRAEAAIDNYIGRFWAQRNPQGAVANLIARIKSKKPFEGPKSFTKQRTFDYFVEGLDAGLVPPTYNYVESQLAKIQEMERLIGATHTLAAEQSNGRAKPVMRGKEPPVDADGDKWVRIDDTEKDPAFNVYGPQKGMVILPDEAKNAGLDPSDVEVIGPRVIGHWYAPKDAVAVWNNHLSKGMRGNPVYDMLAAPGAAATQMILGVSGFHGTVIATEGMFSDMVMAAEHAMSGNAKEAGASLLNIARTPASSAISALSPQKSKAARLAFGAKVMAEYRKPGTYPELAKVIDGMIAGGFRGDPTSELWSGERTKAFKKAIEQALHGDTKLRQAWGASKVPLDAVYAGLEVAAAPLMSRYVPLMKTAATYRAVAQRLQELPSDISPDAFHKEMWDVVNEMDYRFGQVIYDNHFINRFAKDLAQAIFLAPGWTFGTLALMGRGARDVAVAPKRIYDRARGTGDRTQPILGRSGKYWVAAVVGTMGLSGLITRMLTNSNPGDEDPDGWKDFFAFRDGTYDADGNAVRHTIPGYLMHDVYGWSHHPYNTFMNKLSPFLAFAGRVMRNETFYGDMVRNPDDDALTQVKQVGKEAVKELGTPLSVQNYLEGRKRDQGGPSEMARNAIGVSPARREFVRTAAQNKMAEFLARKGHTSLTPEEVEARQDAASEPLASQKNLIPIQKRFKQLTLEQAYTVFDLGSDWEKDQWRHLLETKARNAAKKERMDARKGIEPKIPQ